MLNFKQKLKKFVIMFLLGEGRKLLKFRVGHFPLFVTATGLRTHAVLTLSLCTPPQAVAPLHMPLGPSRMASPTRSISLLSIFTFGSLGFFRTPNLS